MLSYTRSGLRDQFHHSNTPFDYVPTFYDQLSLPSVETGSACVHDHVIRPQAALFVSKWRQNPLPQVHTLGGSRYKCPLNLYMTGNQIF